MNQSQEEIERDIEKCREETQLPGEWKEVELKCPHCSSDQYIYIYDDKKTCYCCSCDLEFNALDMEGILFEGDLIEEDNLTEMVTDDPKTVSRMADRLISKNDSKKTQTLLPGFTSKTEKQGWSKDGWKSEYSSYLNSCTHRPQHIIAGDGWGVWAGKKDDCRSYAKDYDVVMNLTFTSIKEPHIIPIAELAEYEEVDCQYTEIQLDWPDYGVINMPREFWVKLLKYLEDNQLKMLVFCLGGHGRTGTALAVMMTMALGYSPKDSINWIRKNYCRSAIESLGQEEYIERMGTPERELKEEKDGVKSEAAAAGG